MDCPLVSVIIPAYNRGPFLGEAIDSALSQTYRHTEVIVIDDGSTDNTRDVAESYGNRIRFLRQPNGGPAIARNLAIWNARGDVVALLDSDDRWLPHKLERQLPLLDQPRVGLVHSAFRCFRQSDGSFLPDTFVGERLDLHDLLTNAPVGTQTLLFPRKVFFDVGGFDDRFPPAEDWDFTLRVAAKYAVVGCPEVLAEIRLHDDQLTGDRGRTFHRSMAVLRANSHWHGRCNACRRAISIARNELHAAYYRDLNHRARLAAANGKTWRAAALGMRALWHQPKALLRLLRQSHVTCLQ